MTVFGLPAGMPIVEQIFEKGHHEPGAIALRHGARTLTYGELIDRAGALAAELQRRGVARVAVCAERSIELVVEQLAVMAAGAAYIPVDPALPPARRAFYVADAPADLLLTASDLAAPAASFTPHTDLDGLAYVIYTSGSTGRPKGVEVTHRGLANLAAWTRTTFAVTAADTVSFLAGLGFDATVWELWPALAAGATVAIPEHPVQTDPERLRDWLLAEQVSWAFAPTLLAERLIELPWPEHTPLRHLLTGGDRLRRHPRPGLPFTLSNAYGPTECSVVATCGPVPATGGTDAPLIGRPIPGITALVVDADGGPVPQGTVGELHLAGAGLARGYAGRPDLTAERFATGADGVRRYRTGDLASVQADGSLAFHGRADDQVQIRGQRIEPAEVAAVLLRRPEVRDAVVVAHHAPDGTTALVAYCTPADTPADVDPAALRAALRAELPAWAVPQAVVVLERIPVNANGKIDRAALPAPERRVVAPRDDTERELLTIWSAVLQVEGLGVEDPFDEVGGHSLAAAQVTARIAARFGVEVAAGELLAGATITAVAARLAAGDLPRSIAPQPVAAATAKPLSSAQQRMWFLHGVAHDPAVYTNGLVFTIDGPLDVDALQTALAGLIGRHDALRTRYADGPDGPRQIVEQPVTAPLQVLDLGGTAPDGHFRGVLARPIDLTSAPLLRATVARGEHSSQLLLAVHHIAVDGWSIGVLLRDLQTLYAAACAGTAPALPELAIQFSDVGSWERDVLAGPEHNRLVDWWRTNLDGVEPVLDLPTDRPRPKRQENRGATVVLPVAADLVARIDAVSTGERVTPFVTILAALAVVLRRWSGRTDLVVGTPVAGRSRPELETVVGCLVNTVPLRCDLSGGPSFRGLLRRTAVTCAGALTAATVPFERIVGLVDPDRRSGQPLVQVLLAVQPPAPAVPGMRFVGELHADVAQFDLTFAVEERAGATELAVQYNTQLFEPETATGIGEQLLTLLAAALADPAAHIDTLPLTADPDAALRLGRGERTGAAHGPAVPELVAEQAQRRPDAVAVEAAGAVLRYGELLTRAAALAAALRTHGVATETPVAVCLPRTIAAVIAMVGVMRAGGCYVPLDPAHPDQRIGYALDDVGPAAIVTTAELAPRFAGRPARLLIIDAEGRTAGAGGDASAPVLGPHHLAYVIQTSGSTGRPKGVLGEHGGLRNMVLGKIDRFDVRADSRVLQYVSFGFGVSIADVFTTLVAGATLVLRGDEALAGPQLLDLIAEQRITNLVVPASVLASAPFAELPLLRSIAVGGEPCSADLVARWASGRRFVQAYGPSEATVCATTAVCTPDGRRPGVGHPLPNIDVLILDERGNPVPAGVPGELHLAGAGLARGYVGNPAATAERFVPNPFPGGGSRLYRTGDRARFRADATIELLGRADDQVQLRGVRVELGDVEAALRAHPQVADAAAAVHEHPVAGQQLVGYVVPGGAVAPPVGELRTFVRERLPDQLVPAVLVVLPALPRTATGKLHRRGLPAPPEPAAAPARQQPLTLTEQLIVRIWADVLGTDAFDAGADFFAIGGQSLLATQVAGRIREAFEIDLPARVLFDAPTVAELADAVETALLTQLDQIDRFDGVLS